MNWFIIVVSYEVEYYFVEYNNMWRGLKLLKSELGGFIVDWRQQLCQRCIVKAERESSRVKAMGGNNGMIS